MVTRTYTTNPHEIYTLELQKLQRSFSDMQKFGEEASELTKVGWRHVEFLRHVNFILSEAAQAGEAMLKIYK